MWFRGLAICEDDIRKICWYLYKDTGQREICSLRLKTIKSIISQTASQQTRNANMEVSLTLLIFHLLSFIVLFLYYIYYYSMY